MGRSFPYHCKHGKCLDPGDESYGLQWEECEDCSIEAEAIYAKRAAELLRKAEELIKELEAAKADRRRVPLGSRLREVFKAIK